MTTLMADAAERLLALLDLPLIRGAAHDSGVDLTAAASELIDALTVAVAEQEQSA